MRPSSLSPMALALVVSSACATNRPTASTPTLPEDRYAKCSVEKSQSRPFIVEWQSADRAQLESLSKRGIVAVKYTGCEMEVLTRCKVKGEYRYTPVTLQSERITIRDADELYAKVPVGAARLEAELQKSGQLNVDTAIVGTYDAESTAARDDLDGACDRATHVLTSLTVGAFEFYSGAAVSVAGGGSVLGMGAGARTESARTLLSRSGRGEACAAASTGDASPPEGCGALLRVEATPIAPARAAKTVAPVEPLAPSVEPPTELADPPLEPPPEPAGERPAEPEVAAEPPPAQEFSGGPPPPRGRLEFGPGFLLGIRGPFALHFGELEDGVSLHRYAPFTAGIVLETGYRVDSVLTLALTGSFFAGSASSSNDECPTGVKCRAILAGVGADVILTPLHDERLWIGLGGQWSYMVARRETESTSTSPDQIDTDRRYTAVGPQLSIGTDFADSYVPQIQYGVMIAYSMRFGLSASGKNLVNDVAQPGGDAGITHTILFLGRFHFDLGVTRHD